MPVVVIYVTLSSLALGQPNQIVCFCPEQKVIGYRAALASELILIAWGSSHECRQVVAPALASLHLRLRHSPSRVLLLGARAAGSSLASRPAPVVLPPVSSGAVQVAASLHTPPRKAHLYDYPLYHHSNKAAGLLDCCHGSGQHPQVSCTIKTGANNSSLQWLLLYDMGYTGGMRALRSLWLQSSCSLLSGSTRAAALELQQSRS